uniref:hypothetical protein n=1 Tax=Klebsiella pneumoniae TaxID=573 RepID=UPI00300ADFD1
PLSCSLASAVVLAVSVTLSLVVAQVVRACPGAFLADTLAVLVVQVVWVGMDFPAVFREAFREGMDFRVVSPEVFLEGTESPVVSPEAFLE